MTSNNGLCWMCQNAPVVMDGELCSDCLEDIADQYLKAAQDREQIDFNSEWDAAREAEHQRVLAELDARRTTQCGGTRGKIWQTCVHQSGGRKNSRSEVD